MLAYNANLYKGCVIKLIDFYYQRRFSAREWAEGAGAFDGRRTGRYEEIEEYMDGVCNDQYECILMSSHGVILWELHL